MEERDKSIKNYEQSCTIKLDHLGDIDKFSDAYYLPSLNYEKLENHNRPMMSKDIESVIKSLTSKKNPGSNGFIVEFYQTLKEEIIPVIHLFYC
jgi:DNA-directed RNA polymerase delta subunit